MVWSVWVSGMAGGYVLSPELLLQPKSLILVTAPPLAPPIPYLTPSSYTERPVLMALRLNISNTIIFEC